MLEPLMSTPISRMTSVFLPLLLAAAVAGAQTPTAKPPEGWSGQAQISFVSATGNSDARTLGSGGQVQYFEENEWDVIGRLEGVRSSSQGELTAASLTGLTRASHQLRPRLHAFGEFGYLRNRFAGISHREQINGGLALDLLPPGGAQTLQALGSLGYLREAHLVEPLTSAPTANAGAHYKLALSDHSSIQDDVTFVENLNDTTDWRVAHQASVVAEIAAALSLKLSQQLEYLRKPVPGFRRTDTLTSVALVVTF